MIVYAAGPHEDAARSILGKIEQVILFPIITFMMGLALLVFLWGVYQYVQNAESDEGRAAGRQHMLYGIIGMLVMVSALSILKIAAGTFGIDVNP